MHGWASKLVALHRLVCLFLDCGLSGIGLACLLQQQGMAMGGGWLFALVMMLGFFSQGIAAVCLCLGVPLDLPDVEAHDPFSRQACMPMPWCSLSAI